MAHEFRLPDMGEGLVEAQVVRWIVPVGGEVQVDQPVVEVETDKALVELPSPYAGVVLHHGAPEGETLAVGEVLVVVGDPSETWTPPQTTSPPTHGPPPAGPQAGRGNGGDAAPPPAEPQSGRLAGGTASPPPAGPQAARPDSGAASLPTPTAATGPEAARPDGGHVPSIGEAQAATPEPMPTAAVEPQPGAGGGDKPSRTATAAGPQPGRRARGDAAPIVGSLSEEAQDLTPPTPSPGSQRRPQALPKVRRLARELGVDLATVVATGPHGRLTEDDVVAAAARGSTAATGTPERAAGELYQTLGSAADERFGRSGPADGERSGAPGGDADGGGRRPSGGLVPQPPGAGSDAGGPAGQPPSPAAGRRDLSALALSPVVRRLAIELGVDLGSVTGTGPGGRVTRDDVLAAAPVVDGDEQATTARSGGS